MLQRVIASDAMPALDYVKNYIPEAESVYFALFVGADLPSYTRWRSRGRHEPGSGNYQCTIVHNPGGMSGMRHFNEIYLAKCPLVTYDAPASWGSAKGWLQFDQNYFESTVVTHQQYYGMRTRIDCNVFHLINIDESSAIWVQFSCYDVIEGYYVDYDVAREHGLANLTERGDMSWNRRFAPSYFHPLFTNITKDESYIKDVVESGLPNLDTHLNSAYTKAFESLPAITSNSIANLIEVYSALRSLFTASSWKFSGVGSLSDAWLGYRYAYSTTASDICELAQYVDRMRTFRTLAAVRGHGTYKWSEGNVDYTLRCSIECQVDDYLGVYTEMERLGLALDGYNIWDLIPYSFIADWFFRIGDLLELARTREYASKLTPSAVWFSITREYTNSSGLHQCDYYRWHDHGQLFTASLPSSYLDAGKSTVTWLKRGADALAIIS